MGASFSSMPKQELAPMGRLCLLSALVLGGERCAARRNGAVFEHV